MKVKKEIAKSLFNRSSTALLVSELTGRAVQAYFYLISNNPRIWEDGPAYCEIVYQSEVTVDLNAIIASGMVVDSKGSKYRYHLFPHFEEEISLLEKFALLPLEAREPYLVLHDRLEEQGL